MSSYEAAWFDVVQLFSATDPIHLGDRRVRYWVRFRGRETERFSEWATDWARVSACAEALRAEHDVAICDRSDKGSLLHLTL
jgi:hypothetical protein